MAAKSSGFAIGIGIQDGASAGLDAINKRIAAMSAPAEKFNKSLAKFGQISGINRAAEGMQTLGDRTLGAARAIERMASPMAAVTSLASLGGVVELSRRWAEAGNQIGKTANALNMPVDRLSALHGAARLAGSSADAMDTSLKGLGDTLSDANWSRPGAKVALLNQLGIQFHGIGKEARTAEDAIGDVADAVARQKSPHAQLRILQQLAMSEDMLPLLQHGRKGLEGFRAKASQTGGVMTGEMAQNAKTMTASWTELGLAIEGVGNRIVGKWSGTATKVLDTTSHWIEHNKDLADSYAELGAGIMALGLLKPVAWVMRLLGLGAVNTAAGTGAVLASPLLLSGDSAGGDDMGREAARKAGGKVWEDWQGAHPNPLAWIWRHVAPHWTGGTAAPAITVPHAPSAAAATMRRVHDYFRGKGLTEEQTAGILSNIAAESGFDPTRTGDNGTSYGLFQEHAARLAAMRSRYRTDAPTEQQQLEYAWDELNGPEKSVLDRLRLVNTAGQSGAVFTGFERPADGQGEAFRRGQAADQFVQHRSGNVHVDVTLRGAPPGTTAHVTTSGAASAGTPRIETSMPMAR